MRGEHGTTRSVQYPREIQGYCQYCNLLDQNTQYPIRGNVYVQKGVLTKSGDVLVLEGG